MLQYVLLAVFAVCAAVSFVARVRVGMLEGAVEHERKTEEQIAAQRIQWERLARINGICAGISLVLCIAIGVINKML